MATIQDKLAESLEVLKAIQDSNGLPVVRSSELSRTHLTRLVKSGFLTEVIKGWYITTSPTTMQGDTTPWYTSYWNFIVAYANSRFGNNWCLSPEISLAIHSGNWTIPTQIVIRSPKGSNNVIQLLHNTSLLDLKVSLPSEVITEGQHKLNIYPLVEALIECSVQCYAKDTIDIRTCLSMIQDPSELLALLLDKGRSTKAGRIAGALRNIGRTVMADTIVERMKRLDYDVREEDPFTAQMLLPSVRETSPYAMRIRLMWTQMRETVIENFPTLPHKEIDVESFISEVEKRYTQDAYHSLSIEGYRVTTELIERVKSGNWQPDRDDYDKEQKNAMAARGYWLAFPTVKESIKKILNGANAGEVVETDLSKWHYELFEPSVSVGLLKATDLAGYRTSQVYIRGSMHTPLNKEALRDAMPVLFELLKGEPNAAVRAILGHFIFVHVHPYMDGNGRLGRFLMNTMLASGGISWTVVPVERRTEYMQALEKASVEKDIVPFTRLIASLIDNKANIL